MQEQRDAHEEKIQRIRASIAEAEKVAKSTIAQKDREIVGLEKKVRFSFLSLADTLKPECGHP